jgi:hypothetical protein
MARRADPSPSGSRRSCGPPRSAGWAAVLANRSFPSPMLEEPQDFRETLLPWVSRPAGEPVRAIRMRAPDVR